MTRGDAEDETDDRGESARHAWTIRRRAGDFTPRPRDSGHVAAQTETVGDPQAPVA
jgi:hypothetical protein